MQIFPFVRAPAVVGLLFPPVEDVKDVEKAEAPSFDAAGVHSFLETAFSESRVAGAVGLVARGSEVLSFDAVCMADREAGKPMEKDTLFRIASMTKPITSVAVMALFDEGRIALDDPVSKFIPEFGKARVLKGDGSLDTVEAAREITIRHLLTHTSGITYRFVGIEPIATLYEDAGVSDGLVETEGTIAEGVRRLAGLPLLHQSSPGNDGATACPPTSWAGWWKSFPARGSTSSCANGSSRRSE
jgi:CubicO group peptidase (beta-lactamase class C family)